MPTRIIDAWEYRDLIRSLVGRDLRLKYKGSSLGLAWSLFNPLVMAAVYTFAFRYIVRVPIEHFPVYLLSGLLPWTFFSSSLLVASEAVVGHGGLIRKVAFPRAILPVAAVTSQLIQFLTTYVVLILLALYSGVGVSKAHAALIPLVALQFVFTVGLAFAFSTSQVFFRDTRHLLEVLLQIWFWLTPIVYSLPLVPEGVRAYFWLNPMTAFVTAYHLIVIDHQFPGPVLTGSLIGMAGAVVWAGYIVFERYERKFAELV